MTVTADPDRAGFAGADRSPTGWAPGGTTSSCSPGATSCTSPGSRCSSPTSPSSRCCSPCCSSTCSAPGVPIHGGSYKDFALAGLLLLNLTTSAMGTAVGLSTDLTTGAIDRFRTLPMWRSAVLVGRSIADVLSAALCVAIVALTGLAIGWRPGARAASVLGRLRRRPALQLRPLLGLRLPGHRVSKGPESAQGVGLIILFPLAIVSNAMVPTSGMPGWLQAVANWNPVSAVTAAVPAPLRQPQPVGRHPRLADAAPGGGRPRLVAGHPRWSSPPWPPSSTGAAPPAEPTEASAPADGPVPVARG